MQNRYVFILIVTLFLVDIATINSAFFISDLFNAVPSQGFLNHLKTILTINLTWVAAALINRMYYQNRVQTFKDLLVSSATTLLTQSVILLILSFTFSNITILNVDFISVLTLEFLLLSVTRLVIYFSQNYTFNLDLYKKKIAIIGNNDLCLKLEDYFNQNKLTYEFSGSYQYLGDAKNGVANETIADLKSTVKFAIENNLDEVYTTLFPQQHSGVNELLDLAEQNCVRIKFVTSYIDLHNLEENISSAYKLSNFYNGIPILVVRHEPLTLVWNRIIKRAFDIVFSLFVIVFLLSWLFPLIMILIKLESKGPTIFSQLRSGKNNKPFLCFKFRSMRVNANSHMTQATKGDVRITRIGAFMRKTSLDEFPQFFNVLLGNMSIVGPRPHMLKHTEEYRQIIDQYMVRHYLKPGITGWAQVNGHRGETKEHQQMLDRVEHDVWYMENWSIAKDLEIIYKTVANVAKGEENAY